MANTKSSKKDIRRIAKKTVRNKMVKSSLKTYVKKVRVAAGANDVEATSVAIKDVASAMDKAVQRGVVHKNQAARRKSRAAKAANALLAAGGNVVVAKPTFKGKSGKVVPKAAVKAEAKPKPEAKPAAPKAAPAKAAPVKAAAAKKPAAPKAAAAKKPAAKKAKAE